MQIYIPTLARPNKQVTWNSLPESVRERACLLVDWREKDLYKDYPHIVLPRDCRGIGAVRQWVITRDRDKVVMLDDDLVFFRRRLDEPTKFEQATSEDVVALFDVVEQSLDDWAMVGVRGREGANVDTEPYLYNVRLLRFLAYRTDILREENIRFDRLPVMEDFDVELSLLERGHPVLCVNWMVHNQGSSNAPGGCSEYRTMKKQEEAAWRLRELHPGVVEVVTKQTKTAWNGQERTDVRIRWKDAYQRARLLDQRARNGADEEGDIQNS